MTARNRIAALQVFAVATVIGVYFATQLHLAYPPPYRKPFADALLINLAGA